MAKIKDKALRLHTTGFANVIFQVCFKVTILFYLFDIDYNTAHKF